MKGFVYILKSVDNRFYIGSTSDLQRRILQHTRGHTQTTRRMKGVKLVLTQEFKTLAESREVEKKLKSWHRKDFIEKIVRDGRITSVS